jgi:acyl-coenzyme A thioesterase PaaI-like protein
MTSGTATRKRLATVAGAVLVALSLIAIGLAIYTDLHAEHRTDCLSDNQQTIAAHVNHPRLGRLHLEHC